MNATDVAAAPVRTRRSVLASAAGAAAVTAAAALGRPLSAAAADGDPLILGVANFAPTTTSLQGQLWLSKLEVTEGVQASSDGTPGIVAVGSATHPAIEALNDLGGGIRAWTDARDGATAIVASAAREGGIALRAHHAEGGVALSVLGRAQLVTRSGRATIRATRSTVDVDLRQKGGLSGVPLCFAILMSRRPGVFVTTMRPNYPVAGKARVYLNRSVTEGTYVAWFVLN